MFNRFTKGAGTVVRRAEYEARELGSPTTEAEHLLLAVLGGDDDTAAAVGLDRETVVDALDAERERSLMAVGIVPGDFDLPPRRIDGHPRMAASAKAALERALKAAAARRDRRIEAGHVLIGVLQAEAGTVPRALAEAGVDRIELKDRAAAVLDERQGR